jgi:hypothetical protein
MHVHCRRAQHDSSVPTTTKRLSVVFDQFRPVLTPISRQGAAPDWRVRDQALSRGSVSIRAKADFCAILLRAIGLE